MYLTDSDTIKICWYWPNTDTDTRTGATLQKWHRLKVGIWCFIVFNFYVNTYVHSWVVFPEMAGRRGLQPPDQFPAVVLLNELKMLMM